jgi:hypothetical protein
VGFLSLIDDKNGTAVSGGDVVPPSRAKGLEAGPAVVDGEGDGEDVTELAIEVHGAALRVLEGANDDVGQSAKALSEQAKDDALAGARVSRDHGEAAIGDAEFDAPEVAVDGGGDEECTHRDVGTKRMELESVERQ